MKRVLEVVGRMDRAGQETFLMNVLRANDPNKYEITFSVNTEHIGAYEAEILALGGKIWHNPYPISPKTLLSHLKSFKKFLLEEGPFDVIHCHVYFFGGFIMRIAKEVGIPVRVMHSHNTNDGRKNSILRLLYRLYSFHLIKKYATDFVACGVDAYEALFKEKCVDESKILNNAVIMDNFRFLPEQSDIKRRELHIPGDSKVIINVARFCEVKNHEKIISIFREYHKLNCNSVLLLVGEGERMSYIKNLVHSAQLEESVRFMGLRSDIPELLNISDVLLMPSLFEGLPVSLIEAQASGVPCVISDTITNEVDMGLGIVNFVPLTADDNLWANILYESAFMEKPSFEARYACMTDKGYTINATWDKLQKIYDKK